MAELKWSGKQVIDFLNLFQNYPCLWDVSSNEYLCRNLKEAAYSKLLENLKDAGMPTTVEQVKKKIKSLRDTYRKELSKIKKSQKSGAGANEVYKSKLMWFSTAEVFWHGAVTPRESSSNMEILQLPVDEGEHASSSDTDSMLEKTASQVVKPSQTSRPIQSASTTSTSFSSIKRPSTTKIDQPRAKVFKMPNKHKRPTRFESSVHKLHLIAQLTGNDIEDQYDKFGLHIASQLRQLPMKSFILLQSKFQNLITEERLAALNDDNSEPLSVSILNTTEVDYPSHLTSTSNSTSNNEFENIYSEQSQNTCLDEEEHPPTFDVLSNALINICPLDD